MNVVDEGDPMLGQTPGERDESQDLGDDAEVVEDLPSKRDRLAGGYVASPFPHVCT